MTADEIVWEDPPEPASTGGRPASVWGPFVRELQKHPGKWAIARSGGKGPFRFGSTRTLLKEQYGCECAQRKQPDGLHTLYARWPEAAS